MHLFTFITVFIFSLNLFAQTQEFTISPQYSEQEIANTPFDSITIEQEDLNCGIQLNNFSGMTAFSSGPDGQQETLFLQGAEGEDLLVLIDGIKVNDPSSPNGKFDLSMIDKSNIERIEILKGPQSGLYGADAFAGVINIITKQKDRTLLTINSGAHTSYGATLSHQSTYNNTSYGLHTNIKHSDGFSAIKSGTENDSYDYKSAQIKVTHRDGVNIYKGQVEYLKKDNDIDQGTADDPNYTLSSETLRSRIYLSTQLFDNFYKPEFYYNYTKLHRHSLNLADSSSSLTEDSIYRSNIHNISLNHHLIWSTISQTTLGSSFSQESMSSTTITHKIMDTGSLYFQHKIELKKTKLTANIRYDNTSYNNSFTTYRVGLSHLFHGFIAQASYAIAAKNPTLFQLYSSFGEINLKEEKQNGGNISLAKHLSTLKLKINFFYYKMDELIDFNMTTFKYYNNGKAKRKGYEFNAQYDWDSFTLIGNYTYTVAVDSTGSYLLRRPRHQANINLAYRYKLYHFKLKTNYIGKRSAYPSGTLPSFVVSNLSVDYAFNQKLSVNIIWKNIFNKDYEFIKGYQTEGSALYGQLNYRF